MWSIALFLPAMAVGKTSTWTFQPQLRCSFPLELEQRGWRGLLLLKRESMGATHIMFRMTQCRCLPPPQKKQGLNYHMIQCSV